MTKCLDSSVNKKQIAYELTYCNTLSITPECKSVGHSHAIATSAAFLTFEVHKTWEIANTHFAHNITPV